MEELRIEWRKRRGREGRGGERREEGREGREGEKRRRAEEEKRGGLKRRKPGREGRREYFPSRTGTLVLLRELRRCEGASHVHCEAQKKLRGGSKEMVSDVIFFSVEHTHFGTDEKSPNPGNSKFGFRIKLWKIIKIQRID